MVEYPDLSPVSLTGESIALREVDSVKDARAALAWASDVEFFKYLPHEAVSTEAEEETFLRHLQAEALARPRREYHLGIVRRHSDQLIGMARLGISSPEHGGADIGYGVPPDLWGRGIATEAAALLLAFGFEQLGLHRIFAYHHPDNIASGRVLQKLGMQREGRLRHNMLAHGVWRDSIAYAVLEDEWPEARIT